MGSQRSRGWVVIAVGVMLVIVAVGVLAGLHLTSGDLRQPTTSAPPRPTVSKAPDSQISTAPTDLNASFAELAATVGGSLGVSYAAVGSTEPAVHLGNWISGPAWSTMKVPLAIAALRAQDTPGVTAPMDAAITESDNAAADTLWTGLGTPDQAAGKIDAVLREAGDPTTVESRKIRPEYSAFGQTDWSLTNQARFLAAAVCDARDAQVFELMGRIGSDQSWGLGTVAGTRFKGGWGPSETGAYLVRQLGIMHTDRGDIAVAIAAQPNSGSFADGTTALTTVSSWLQSHAAELPAGRCR